MPAPPFEEYRASGVSTTPSAQTRLVAAGQRQRDVLEDDDAWLARHGLTIADLAAPTARALVPADVRDVPLTTLRCRLRGSLLDPPPR